MSEQKNENNSKDQKGAKASIALILRNIIVIGLIIAIALLSSGFTMFKDDMEEASKIKKSQAISVNSQGQFVYTSTNEKSGYTKETTAQEMAKELEPSLGEYIKKTEEENVEAIEYLLGAEIVTKMPYIDNMPEGELNGNIKFYRYIKETEEENEINGEDVKEENRLKFMKLEEFNAKLEAFKTDPNSNRDIYNYFSIDEDGAVLIAYGSEENRTIQTGIESSLKDRDLTAEIINANSGENYTGNNDTGYSASKYEINTKKVDYLSLVGQYVMPANLLNSLLIHTGDIDFVTEIAKLAYESEIAIGIYDNRSHYEKKQTYTYYKMLDLEIDTSLSFKDTLVNITNIGKPDIKLTYEDLKKSPYKNKIFVSCESFTNENGKIDNHEKTYLTGGATGGPVDSKDMYIAGTDANNKITSLGQATSFKTMYRQTIESMSMPTVGILVADTWISRWESTYTKVENNPGATSTGDTEVADTVNIQEYADKESVLNAFESVKKANVEMVLKNHEKALREDAIKSIINNTNENIYKVNTVPVNTTQLLTNHIRIGAGRCTNCVAIITSKGLFSEDDAVIEEEIKNGVLKNTIVESDYNAYVQAARSSRESGANSKKNKRKEEFEKQLRADGTITTSQNVKGKKDYKDITQNSTTETITTRYEKTVTQTDRIKEKDGEKFSKIFNSSKFHESREAIKTRDGWLWDYIRENEDTANLEEILRYLLNIATKSEMFGKIEDIDEIFNALEPKMQKFGSVSGAVSPFGTDMPKEDFVLAAQNYNKNTEYYQRNLASIAGEFYDICTKMNVNPGMAYAWACVETGFGKDNSIPDNNLFGMAVYNGKNSGSKYATREDSIEDFCQWVIKNSTSNATYSQAQQYASVNSIFEGSPENNIYALFCRYMYLGDTHIADEPDFNNPAGEEYYKKHDSTWGAGGRIYIYHMYELGGLYENQYAERCGHPNGSDETTLQEKADYVHYQVKKRIKIATDIFGNQVFLGGDGTYQKSDESEIRGYYTSSSGKTYKEWIQATNVGCGRDSIKYSDRNGLGWRCMGAVGCPIYAAAILTSAEGIDVTPRIINESYYNGNENSTLTAICKGYNIGKTAKAVYSKNTFISKLQEGYGFVTYVTSGSGFANRYHWIVVADIRPTELGSSEGYDIYILSSTTRGLKETRWHPIEKVTNNLKTAGYYGSYISE